MNLVHRQWMKIKNFVQNHRFLSAYIAGFFTWIVVQVGAGILSNSAYEVWKKGVQPWLITSVVVSRLTQISIFISGTILSSFLLWFILRRTTTTRDKDFSISELSIYLGRARSQELQAYQEIMDEINNYFQMALIEVNEQRLNKLIDNYFLTIYRYLGPEVVNGGGILLLEEENKEWLYFWRMGPDQLISPKRFYIGKLNNGKEGHPLGVGGVVFQNDKPEIVKIHNRTTGESDNLLFHQFNMSELGHPRYVIPYESFICLPIHFGLKIIGVLSIESQKNNTFDNESIQRLQPIANQLGTILFYFGVVRNTI